MFKAFFTNSFGILTSRIFGFIRDMLQASILGANIYTDIFIVAFKIPNLFRRVFAEGAFSQSFLPQFIKAKKKGVFATQILKKFILFLLFISILVTIFSNSFTRIIATGFSDKIIELASPLVAINFYYLILVFIVTYFATLLQYKNHFATSAFSTAILNITLIFTMLYSKDLSKYQIVYNLSIAVIIGGILQVLVHIIAIKKLSIHKLLIASFMAKKSKKDLIKDDIKEFKSKFLASTIGTSTAQISAFLDGWLASFLVSGSISYLYYANRVFQFPLALFSIAISTAIFPKVARYIKNQNELKAKLLLKNSFWFLIIILSIATITGIIFSKEIVWLLYQRGHFNQNDTQHSAIILTMYLIGLLPFGLSKIFSLWLYSNHRQNEAAKISMISLLFNIILSLLLIFPLQASGLALASSLSGFVLFFLTIRAFGIKDFKEIAISKNLIYLIIFLAILSFSLISLKEIVDTNFYI